MSLYIEKVLEGFNFERTCDESYEDRIEDFWELKTKHGMLQFNTHEDTLYIWSGLGMCSYTTNQYYDKDNSMYGYPVPIFCAEQLSRLLSMLV